MDRRVNQTARIFRIINFVLAPLVLIVEDVSQTILRWSGGQVFKGQLFGNREEMRAVMRESGQALTHLGAEHQAAELVQHARHRAKPRFGASRHLDAGIPRDHRGRRRAE